VEISSQQRLQPGIERGVVDQLLRSRSRNSSALDGAGITVIVRSPAPPCKRSLDGRRASSTINSKDDPAPCPPIPEGPIVVVDEAGDADPGRTAAAEDDP